MSDKSRKLMTEKWVPRAASLPLQGAMEAECRSIEAKLMERAQHEKRMSVNGFDSGLPFEGLIRDSIAKFLPSRYAVSSGVVLDAAGNTCGGCDIVISNSLWFSSLKPREGSGDKEFFPVESIYAVGEVKQTINKRTLIDAMKKLVIARRLAGQIESENRITENRSMGCGRFGGEFFTFIVAGGVGKNYDFDKLVFDFRDVSRELDFKSCVSMLYILGHGVLLLVCKDGTAVKSINLIGSHHEGDVFIAHLPHEYQNGLYSLVSLLVQSMFDRVLCPDNHTVLYGYGNNKIKIISGDDGFVYRFK